MLHRTDWVRWQWWHTEVYKEVIFSSPSYEFSSLFPLLVNKICTYNKSLKETFEGSPDGLTSQVVKYIQEEIESENRVVLSADRFISWARMMFWLLCFCTAFHHCTCNVALCFHLPPTVGRPHLATWCPPWQVRTKIPQRAGLCMRHQV